MSRAAAQSIINNRDHSLGSAYPVTLPVFEGPLDLLLHLIEREELDISEVSLLAVTDQYLQTLEHLEAIEPGALTDFLVIASRLLVIKSNKLLPQAGEGEEDEEDAGDSLITSLLEYRRFKQAAASLKLREDQGVRVYVRLDPPDELKAVRPTKPDPSNVDLASLHDALRRALLRVPIAPPAPRIEPYKVTLSEQIEAVRVFFREKQNMQTSGDTSSAVAFSDSLGHACSQIDVVITFLAVLQLIKQDELRAVQNSTFGEIMLLANSRDEETAPADAVQEGLGVDTTGAVGLRLPASIDG